MNLLDRSHVAMEKLAVLTQATKTLSAASLRRILLLLAGVLGGVALTLYVVDTGRAMPVTGITALLTACAALLGVLITNVEHSDRLDRQLSHDRELQGTQLEQDRNSQRQEREIAYRKELYADAVGASENIFETFNQFLDGSADFVQITKSIEAPKVLVAKVKVVSDDITVQSVDTFLASLRQSLLDVLDAHAELVISQGRCEGLKERSKSFLAQASKCFEPHATDAVTQSGEQYADAQTNAQFWIDKHTATGDELEKAQAARAEKFRALVPVLKEALWPLLQAKEGLRKSLRRELRALVAADSNDVATYKLPNLQPDSLPPRTIVPKPLPRKGEPPPS